MKTAIDQGSVTALAIGARITDTTIPGFRAFKRKSGRVTFELRYINAAGREKTVDCGMLGEVTVKEARSNAAKALRDIKVADRDPQTERQLAKARSTNTVDSILDKWLAAKRGELRSIAEIERTFARHVRPAIGDVVIYDLGRDQVTAMLDKITATAPYMAKRTRAYLNSAFNWHRDGDQNFVTMPMPSQKRMIKEHKRDRFLADDEIRDLWIALGEMEKDWSSFPALVRMLLLTACRREEVAWMHTREIVGDLWVIPEGRYKTANAHLTTLNAAMRKVMPARVGFVFASDGSDKPFSGWSKAKRQLDQAIAAIRERDGREPMPAWRLHDLRRTATAYLQKAKVDSDVREAVLGHTVGGIKGVYNVYEYQDEKAEALARWAAHVAGIIEPSPAKVVPITSAQRRNIGG